MKSSDLMHSMGKPVAYYPGMVQHMGSVNAVVLFSQLFCWEGKQTSKFGVYKSTEDLEYETGMSYREQVTARKNLTDRGILIETHKRFEHRIYYRLDLDVLDAILDLANCGKRISGTDESASRDTTKAHFVNKTESTAESTAETTAKKKDLAADAFEEAWQAYPNRPGKNKASALKAWNARLKSGSTAEQMTAGVHAYARFCSAMKTEPSYIKQPATFFGPDLHFASDWAVPAAPIHHTQQDARNRFHDFLNQDPDHDASPARHHPYTINVDTRRFG